MEQPQRAFTPHSAPIRDAKLLPVQAPTQIFGHRRELASCHLAIKAGTPILLYGVSGIGKSATAALLATAYCAQSAGGVLWFNMTEDDLDMLLARVGRAYGINALTADDDLTERIGVVKALLERNRPLIVLDGIVDIQAVQDFGSRVANGIPLIAMSTQAESGPWAPVSLEPFPPDEGLRMLQSLSKRVDVAYAEDLRSIARLLVGNPLALELAGRLLSINEMLPAELLTGLLNAPASASGKADPLQSVINVVFKNLPPSARNILLLIGTLFTGSTSAELLVELSGLHPQTLLPIIRKLVSYGMVRESLFYSQLQFTVHEAIQTFVRHWLDLNGGLTVAENRALQAVLKYTARHSRPDVPNQDRLAAEIDNIVGATAFATATHQEAIVRQFVNELSQYSDTFITMRGFQSEMGQLRKLLSVAVRTEPMFDGIEPPTTALEAVGSLVADQSSPNEPVTQQSLFDKVPPTPAPSVPIVEIPSPDVTGQTTTPETPVAPQSVEPKSEPEPAATVVAPIAPAEPVEIAPVPSQLPPPPSPTVAIPLFQTNPAAAAVEEMPSAPVHEFHAEITDLDLLDEANLATPSSAASELAAAPKQIQEDQPPLESPESLHMLGLDDLQSRIEKARRTGATTVLVQCLEELGDRSSAQRDGPGAIQAFSQAVEFERGAENWPAVARLMEKLAGAYQSSGRFTESGLMFEQALTIVRRERNHEDEARILTSLGGVHRDLHDWPKALEYLDQAHFLVVASGDKQAEAAVLGSTAEILELQGQSEGAVTGYRRALGSAYAASNRPLAAKFAFSLGRLLMDDSRMLKQSEQLLAESSTALPGNSDVERLLKRVRQRIERMKTAQVAIPEAVSNQDFAAEPSTLPSKS